jgi:hypothetical protein
MYRRIVGIALVLLAATSVSLEAQDGRNDRDAGPIQELLEIRSRIGLTADQVTRLNEIDAAMQQQNEAPVAQLVQVRRSIRALGRRRDFTPEQRAQYEALIDQARPLMKQIRANNHAAMRQVGEVLTQDQRSVLADILRDRDDDDDNGRRRDSSNSRQDG